MDNDIDSDPHRYREEWFDFEMPRGKEFDLPNISNALMHYWTRNSNSKVAKPNNHLPIQASVMAGINDVQNCNVQNASLTADPQAISTSDPSPPTDANQLNVPNVSCLENHSPIEPIPVKIEQAVDEGTLNSANSHPTSIPNHSFSSIATNPGSSSSYQNSSEKMKNPKVTDESPSGVNPKSVCLLSNDESHQNGDKVPDPISLARNNTSLGSHLSDSLIPKPSDGLISPKKKETLVPNDYPVKPIKPVKQEVEDQVEFNPSQQQPHEDRNSPCCLHKLTLQAHHSDDFEGDHKCFVCNMGFSTGNALGGHMSSHAKKRKMEVMKNGGGLAFFKSDEEGPQQGSENSSNKPPYEPTVSTESAASTEEKIEGSEPSNKQD